MVSEFVGRAAVLRRGYSGELAKLADEVGLISVAGDGGGAGEGNVVQDSSPRVLQSGEARKQFGWEAGGSLKAALQLSHRPACLARQVIDAQAAGGLVDALLQLDHLHIDTSALEALQ